MKSRLPFSKFFFKNKDSFLANKETLDGLWRLQKIILESNNYNDLVKETIDSVFKELRRLELGYKLLVLFLVDEEDQKLKIDSITQTDDVMRILTSAPIPLEEVHIPIDEDNNVCIKSIKEYKQYSTRNWFDIFRPSYSQEEAQRIQKSASLKTIMVYPINYHGKTKGVLLFNSQRDEEEIKSDEKELLQVYTNIVCLAVQSYKLEDSIQNTTKKLVETNNQYKSINQQLQNLGSLKDEFVTMASHELRTPMTAIRGSLSTILEGYAGDISSEVREFLVAAYNENDRLIRLVNNLLNISRIESGHFEFETGPVNINEVIADVTTNLNSAAIEKNLTLNFIPNSGIPVINSDGDKIHEVLNNIIGNAIKYTHKGGITVKLDRKDGMIVISIADTGSGIAKEDQDLLFRKFSQIHGNYARTTGGTGLGLYISKKIIEGLKGKIWLDSVIGKGSKFYFSLPIVT
ncbi:ATP-binding protein [Patescibacteria group bacterium]